MQWLRPKRLYESQWLSKTEKLTYEGLELGVYPIGIYFKENRIKARYIAKSSVEIPADQAYRKKVKTFQLFQVLYKVLG